MVKRDTLVAGAGMAVARGVREVELGLKVLTFVCIMGFWGYAGLPRSSWAGGKEDDGE